MRKNHFVAILLLLSIIFCLCSHIYCLFLYRIQPLHIRKNVKRGEPYIFQSDEDYFSDIYRFRITDDYVYVLYGGKSIVKVYRHDGTYIGTIAVYDKRASGRTRLDTDHSRAYIEIDDCLYEFEGIDFKHCYMIDSDPTNKRLEVQKYAVPSPDYSFRFGNVIKYENTPDEFVFIKRDLLHRIANPRILLPAEFCIFMIWFLIVRLRAK